MATHKLAECLLRRKELQDKVVTLKSINVPDYWEIKAKRVKVSDSIDDLKLQVPLIDVKQVTAALDWHSKQLRLVDGAIQQANWTTQVEVADTVMQDYVEPKELQDRKKRIG